MQRMQQIVCDNGFSIVLGLTPSPDDPISCDFRHQEALPVDFSSLQNMQPVTLLVGVIGHFPVISTG